MACAVGGDDGSGGNIDPSTLGGSTINLSSGATDTLIGPSFWPINVSNHTTAIFPSNASVGVADKTLSPSTSLTPAT
jgi:hypothetical protein